MRKFLSVVTLTILFAVPASAQRLNLDFPGLSDRASEVVDVTLDAQMLRAAAKFFSSKSSDERNIRDLVQRLDGIYVRSYTFDKDGEYDRNIVTRVRSQLGANWKKIVNVRSRDKENVEVFLDMRGEDVAGLVVIAAEPRELTLVNIVGPIDLERLGSLGGQFGIPHISEEKKEARKEGKDRE